MRPERDGRSPMMLLSRVVLPTPLRPMRHTTSPAGTSSETSHRIWLSPYATFRPLTSSMPASEERLDVGRRPAPAEIDFHDPVVLLHLVDRALAEDAALVKHRHRPRDTAHELHVVLDHQNGSILRDRPEKLGRLLGLLVGHPGHRLVDQQELRLLDDDHPDLEPLLLAVAQAARAFAGLVGQPDRGERV